MEGFEKSRTRKNGIARGCCERERQEEADEEAIKSWAEGKGNG